MIIYILVFVIIFIILYQWFNSIVEARQYNVDGPVPLPLIGNGNVFAGKPTRFIPALRELNEKYGDVVRVHLFHERHIFLFHPKYIEEIVASSELINKGISYRYLHPWLGQGLLTATGEKWKTHRKFLTPAFHFNILQNFLPVFLRNEKILIHKLNALADGSDVNVVPVVALCALDNVAESIMGVSFNAQKDSENKYVKSINKLTNIIATRMRNPFHGMEIVYKLGGYERVNIQAIKTLKGYTTHVIQTRQGELDAMKMKNVEPISNMGIKNKYAFLDLLLLAEINGKRIDANSVREEVETFMFEGYDTTTSGISFCLYCLSKYPHVQDKILEEQKSILGDDIFRDPTYNELKQMRYLDLVIRESLRIYPSVPIIQRLVQKDTDISGLRVTKGTSINIDIFHMQRNPKVYDDPLEFRPERFQEQIKKSPFSWLAFSAGPRNCIGQKFAMMEIKVIVAVICKHFTIYPSNIELQLCVDLILSSNNGIHVQLKPRT